MSRKAEISWKSETEDGERREVYAKKVNERWQFYHRSGRYEDWEPLTDPTLEDWLQVLDGVRRRIPRRLFRPEDEKRLVHTIRDRFPDAADALLEG